MAAMDEAVGEMEIVGRFLTLLSSETELGMGRFFIHDGHMNRGLPSQSDLVLFVDVVAPEPFPTTPLADIPEPSPDLTGLNKPRDPGAPWSGTGPVPLSALGTEPEPSHGGIGTEPGRAIGMFNPTGPIDWWRVIFVVLATLAATHLIAALVALWGTGLGPVAHCSTRVPCFNRWWALVWIGLVNGTVLMFTAYVVWRQKLREEPEK